MKNLHLPPPVQRRVVNFMLSTQANLDSQRELDNFLTTLSPSLRLQVLRFIFASSIRLNPLLALHDPNLIDFVVHKLVTLLYLPEDLVLSQGDLGFHMFFLAKGHCDVVVKDQHNIQSSVRLLKTGMLFGEVALIATSRRTASVRALNYCTVAALSASHFLALHNRFPTLLKHLKRAMIGYRDPWKCYLKKSIQSIPHFSHIHA